MIHPFKKVEDMTLEELKINKKLTKVSIVICLITLIGIATCTYLVSKTDFNTCHRFAREADSREFNGLYGFANLDNPDKPYYCVYTDHRMIEEIQATETHEQCHILVDDKYDHFCKAVDYDYYKEGLRWICSTKLNYTACEYDNRCTSTKWSN